MFTETVQLESLRQKIEDAEYEAGNQSDYLDRGKPNPAQAKKAQELIGELNNQSKRLKGELKDLIATVRAQQPQAIEEWVSYHIGILQKIIEENNTDVNAATRRNVANGTLKEWEKVRAGEQEYVGINWYYLKDYKTSVRTISGGRTENVDGKAWWRFWK